MHPHGNEPHNTYWLRRALVAGAALLSLALVWWVLSSLFGGSSKPATVQATPQNPASLAVDPALTASPTPGATPSAGATGSPGASTAPSGTASATPSPSASSTPAATPTPSSTPTPSAAATCDAQALKLSVDGSSSVTIGKPTALGITVTNTGQAACTLTLGPTTPSLRVTSGADKIWASGDCAAWGPAASTQLLQPGKAVTWKATWPTVRSNGTCTPSKAELRSGTYVAKATLGDASARLVMQLHH